MKPVEIQKPGAPRRIIRMDLIEEKFERLLAKGIFILDSDISEGVSSVLTLGLLDSHSMLDKTMPFWVILNSPGGEVNQGFAVYDIIKMVIADGRHINILAQGQVASMASCILQSASRRFSFRNTQFLIHEVSQFVHDQEKVSEGEERVEENKRINRIVMNLIATRIGMSLDQLLKISKKKDYWLDAEAALKLGKHGLVDEVVDKLPFKL